MAALLTLSVSFGLVFGFAFFIAKLVAKAVQFRKTSALLSKFPHGPFHWLWGHLHEFPGLTDAGLEFLRDRTSKFPYVTLGWAGPFLGMIFVYHPETVKIILKTSEPKGRRTYGFIKPWVGDGLLLSSGNKWNRNRRLLTPAFHFDILRPYVAIKNNAADILLDKLEGFHNAGKYFEVFSHISLYTLDVILKCAFSYKSDCQIIGENHPYVKAVNDLNELAADRFIKPWLHNDWVYYLTPAAYKFRRCCNFVHGISESVVKQRKEVLAQNTQANAAVADSETGRRHHCLDFLDILLTAKDENNEGLTMAEIRDEVDTFLFEGHDTTASGLAWTLYSLAEHPEIQSKIQAEVDSILDGRDSDDILWEDLSKMPYLTMCIKEGLRLHTPVPFIQRELTQDLVIYDNLVPKGTTINVIIYNVHHNSKVWENSLEFIPERFSPENCEGRDPYAFVPFSAGPRNCIGQNFAMDEMKIVLARLLRKFTMELDKNHVVRKKVMAVIKAENGIMMKAIPRKLKSASAL